MKSTKNLVFLLARVFIFWICISMKFCGVYTPVGFVKTGSRFGIKCSARKGVFHGIRQKIGGLPLMCF